MFAVDWQLTLWAQAPAPLISVVVMAFGRRIHDRFEAIQKLFSDISSRVQESVSGVRVVRAYVQEEAELERFCRAEVSDIFPWLYYGKRFDVLRKICRIAKPNAEKHLMCRETRVHCHLVAEDSRGIVASSL